MVLVVTDGQSQDDVAEPAQRLRDAHVMVYAIGVTNLVNVHQLHQVSSLSPNHTNKFIHLDNGERLESFYSGVF